MKGETEMKEEAEVERGTEIKGEAKMKGEVASHSSTVSKCWKSLNLVSRTWSTIKSIKWRSPLPNVSQLFKIAEWHIKKVITKGCELKKQEGYISDPSGYIKIIFWGSHSDTVQQGATFFDK